MLIQTSETDTKKTTAPHKPIIPGQRAPSE